MVLGIIPPEGRTIENIQEDIQTEVMRLNNSHAKFKRQSVLWRPLTKDLFQVVLLL